MKCDPYKPKSVPDNQGISSEGMAMLFKRDDRYAMKRMNHEHGLYRFPVSMDNLMEGGKMGICFLLYDSCITRNGGLDCIKDYIPYTSTLSPETLSLEPLGFKQHVHNIYISAIADKAYDEEFNGELSEILFENLVSDKIKKAAKALLKCYKKNDDSEEGISQTKRAYRKFFEAMDAAEGSTAGVSQCLVASAYISGKTGIEAIPLGADETVDDILNFKSTVFNGADAFNDIRYLDKEFPFKAMRISEIIDGEPANPKLQGIAISDIRDTGIFQRFYRKYVFGLAKHMGLDPKSDVSTNDLAKEISLSALKRMKGERSMLVCSRSLLESIGMINRIEYDEYIDAISDILSGKTEGPSPMYIKDMALDEYNRVLKDIKKEDLDIVTASMVLSPLKRDYSKDEHELICAYHTCNLINLYQHTLCEAAEEILDGRAKINYDSKIKKLEEKAQKSEEKAAAHAEREAQALKDASTRVEDACQDRDERIKELQRELDRLKIKLSDSQAETAELKEQLRIMKEAEPPAEAEEEHRSYTPDDFKDKRLAFVSFDAKGNLDNIRKMFPDAVYIEDEAVPLKSVKADVVVIMARCVSHALCYKIKSAFPKDVIMTYGGMNADYLCDELGKWFEKKGLAQINENMAS